MKQRIEIPYQLKEKHPLQLAVITHDPLNFKQDAEIDGQDYEISMIEKCEVVNTTNFKMIMSERVRGTRKPQKIFSVNDMDEVFNHIEVGEHKMYLHILDIKD